MQMKKKSFSPTLDNILNLFAKRLDEFSGESRRSYQKAFSSFQIYVLSHYNSNEIFNETIVENWLVSNFTNGLKPQTMSFYLDKVASLYHGIAPSLIGGRVVDFKIIKQKLKNVKTSPDISQIISSYAKKIRELWKKNNKNHEESPLLYSLFHFPWPISSSRHKSLKFIWCILALKAGVPADLIRGMVPVIPSRLNFLSLASTTFLSDEEKDKIAEKVNQFIYGEEIQWFALRLRRKVKYESLIERFSLISSEIQMPELFYPCEEITRRVGRKMVWEGKPFIRDVVFFKSRKHDIYPMVSRLYDLAWCYRTPGGAPGEYASIPNKAMDDFKKGIGILNPDFDVMPAGEMKLKAGDKVEIINGDYAGKLAQIIKNAPDSVDGNKIFRISLLNSNGHWDIGIDARFLRKV